MSTSIYARAAKAAPHCAKGQFVHLPCSISVHPAVPDSCRRYYAVISRDTFIAVGGQHRYMNDEEMYR
jgi:hypothetical protein